jgi:small-conductance mechanosensitive channel
MRFISNFEWQPILRDLVNIAIAVIVALATFYLLLVVTRRIQQRRHSVTIDAIIRHLSAPVQLLFALIAISATLTSSSIAKQFGVLVSRTLEISYIAVFAWLVISLVEIVSVRVESRLPENILEDVQARRIHTQVHVLRRTIIGIVLFSAFSAALMTFPSIRTIGAGFVASAGLAGLALGMAARPILGNLLAGFKSLSPNRYVLMTQSWSKESSAWCPRSTPLMWWSGYGIFVTWSFLFPTLLKGHFKTGPVIHPN